MIKKGSFTADFSVDNFAFHDNYTVYNMISSYLIIKIMFALSDKRMSRLTML